MRILIVSDRYPPHSLGGYETAAAATRHALLGQGHDVRVLTSRYRVSTSSVNEEGVWRLLHRPIDSPSLLRQGAWQLGDLRGTRRILAEFSPDAVYAFNLSELFPSVHRVLSDRASILAYNIQDVWVPNHARFGDAMGAVWNGPGTNLRARARRGLASWLAWADAAWGTSPGIADLRRHRLIFCSRYQLERHLDAGLPLARHEVIFNPLATGPFDREVRSPRNGPLRVLFVGRLVQEKGAAEVIEGIRLLLQRGIDAILTVAGPRVYPLAYSEALRGAVRAAALEDRVTFLGNVPNAELPGIYARHDALVFPSTHLEGLPMTLLEAMAARIPVVATLSGGSRELLMPEVNCFGLSQPPDPDEVARQLERLAADEELGVRFTQAARRTVDEMCAPQEIGRRTAQFLEAE